MPELSQDAICELRQSLPLLERLACIFGEYIIAQKIAPTYERQQLEEAYDRVAELTSPSDVKTWVGNKSLPETSRIPDHSFSAAVRRSTMYPHTLAQRLLLYVKGILDNQELDETLDRLTQENTSLKEQLAELSQRELIYLSIIKQAQTSTTYSLPPKSGKILLGSLQRQHETLTKNLCLYQEQKAQYGPLDVPPRIINAIEQIQEELKPVESTIAYLEANVTEIK